MMDIRYCLLVLVLLVGCGEDGSEPHAAVDASMDGEVVPKIDGGDPQDGAPPEALEASTQTIPDGGDGAAPNLPTSSFDLVTPSGTAPLFEEVRSNATGAARTTYDWGEGGGFEATPFHRYRSTGTFTVTQLVANEHGTPATSSKEVAVSSFVPVRFSKTDRTPKVAVIGDGYELEQLGSAGEASGVRSDDAIAPGSGVFYFETQRNAERFNRVAIGIATASASLEYRFNDFPSTARGLAVVLADGTLYADGSCTGGPLDRDQHNTGFVVDYRAAAPTLVLLQAVSGVPSVVAKCVLDVSSPVYIYFSAERASVTSELLINTGQDTTNHPFYYEEKAVRTALRTAGDEAAADIVTFGYSRSNKGRIDSPPALTVMGATTTLPGQPVTLTAQVVDREDGNGTLDGAVSWIDTSLPHHEWKASIGKDFTFTPTTLGIHPVVATIADLDGVVATKTVKVLVQGSLTENQRSELVLTPEAARAGISISPDGLSARFDTDAKCGVRANQGILGKFWYFEVHRNSPTRNMGMGLVTEAGEIVAYEFDTVPWSCSINVLGLGSVYKNLIVVPDAGNWQLDGEPDHADYGFAVDYRGANPRVYVLIANKVQAVLDLGDVWVPLYPMLYGNGPPANGYVPAPFDYTINFGESSFAMDPLAVLSSTQVDVAGLQRGWGATAQ